MVNIVPGACTDPWMAWTILSNTWSAPLVDPGVPTTGVASRFRARREKMELMATVRRVASWRTTPLLRVLSG